MLKKLVEQIFKTDEGLPVVLTNGQEQIINKIVFPLKMKTMILTPTRYGKSYTIAMGAILKACMFKGRKIRIVSGTNEQSKIIQNYIIQHLFDSPVVYKMLAANKGKKRIQKELSKKKIKFINGSEISTLSADILNKGRQLLGHGATDLIIDETAIIPDDIYKMNLLRMIGDSLDGHVYEITNPINRNHAWETWNDDFTDTLHIDYIQGLKEGRFSEKYIDEMRRTLTARQFKIMYEAEFPEDVGQGQLYKSEWINEMFVLPEEVTIKNPYYIGVDVAAEGNDFTVISICREMTDGTFYVERIEKYEKQDTAVTAGRVLQILKSLHPQIEKNVSLDAIGIGKGCYDQVTHEVMDNPTVYQMCNIYGFKTVNVAADKDNYHNVKSELAARLYTLLLNKKIKSVESKPLKFELSLIRETNDSKGRMRAVDPDEKLNGEPAVRDKSPDYYDSLIMALNSWSQASFFNDVSISSGNW